MVFGDVPEGARSNSYWITNSRVSCRVATFNRKGDANDAKLFVIPSSIIAQFRLLGILFSKGDANDGISFFKK